MKQLIEILWGIVVTYAIAAWLSIVNIVGEHCKPFDKFTGVK